jgi:hypothetical protein
LFSSCSLFLFLSRLKTSAKIDSPSLPDPRAEGAAEPGDKASAVVRPAVSNRPRPGKPDPATFPDSLNPLSRQKFSRGSRNAADPAGAGRLLAHRLPGAVPRRRPPRARGPEARLHREHELELAGQPRPGLALAHGQVSPDLGTAAQDG